MRFLPVLSLALLATAVASAQSLKLIPSDAGLRVEADGKLLTEYVTKDVPRPFFYPVTGAAGENLVRNFPMTTGVEGEPQDHPHHRGLWFAHGLVNGQDFWAEKGEFGKQEHTALGDVVVDGATGSFTAQAKWVSSKGETLLTDSRKFTFKALGKGEWTLDFDITLKATEGPVVLGDTKEGSMAIRLAPSLTFDKKGPRTGHAVNSEGDADAAIWGKAANWVAYDGPDPKGNKVSVAMFGHPKNYRTPMTWHARDYGLFAANPFGLHDFQGKKDQPQLGDYKLAKGESLTLRYRFYFAKDKPSAEALNALFKAYSAE